MIIQNARIVLRERILPNGAIRIEDGNIADIYETSPPKTEDIEKIDAGGALVAPGFVDIHAHAGGRFWAYENPVEAARYHLNSGTTSMVLTLYHDIGHEGILEGARRIRRAMENGTPGNIAGIHMEGPYLSKKYGASAKTARIPDAKEYSQYISEFGDLIKQWTFSPEVEGTDAFIEAARAAGIRLAIGHSAAAPERVFEVAEKGVCICTHLANATASSIMPPRYPGTQEVSFDQAVMMCDDIMCEVINDRLGVHVRPLMTKYIVKTIGIDRVMAISDACAADDDDENDINIVNGEIYGSKLTMQGAARNFMKNTGLSLAETFRVCAANPAKAVGLADRGEIDLGKRADILILDDDLSIKAVFLGGVRQSTELI